MLCDWEIENAIKDKELLIDPLDLSLINPNSIDLRLGDHFIKYLDSPNGEIIDPYDYATVDKDYSESTFVKTYIVNPGDFVLARTLEKITLPSFYVGRVEGKSSLARLGINVHQTGGFIDSGFSGTITLEISNVNRKPVKLYAGMPFCQLAISLTSQPRVPYNKKAGSKYNGQVGATLSKYYKNGVV
jgi:dCTP deaminase